MAKIKYLVDLDLSKNQILNAVVQNLGGAPNNPKVGQIYWDTEEEKLFVCDKVYNDDPASWVNLGSQNTQTPTSLSTGTVSATSYGITSDGGSNDVIIASANSTSAGVMSKAKFNEVAINTTKLSNIEANADVTDATNVNNAGAVMNTDTTTTDMGFVIDEDTFATNSATKVPTQQSVKAYIAAQLTSEMNYMGSYDAAQNVPNLDNGKAPIGSVTTIHKGDTYTITGIASNFYGTAAVEAGDMIIAEVDGASTLSTWTIVNRNIPTIITATESAEGIMELATQDEVDLGTITNKAVTPATLSAFSSGTQKSVIGNTAGKVTTMIDTERGHYEVYKTAGGNKVETQINFNEDAGTTTITFNETQTADAYKIVRIS